MEYTVMVDNGAKVFSKKAEKCTRLYLNDTLDVFSGNGDIFFNSKVQDANIKFTIAQNEQSGVLAIQRTMTERRGKLAAVKLFLCSFQK